MLASGSMLPRQPKATQVAPPSSPGPGDAAATSMAAAVPQPAGVRGIPPSMPPTAVGLADGHGPWQPPRVLVVEAERDERVLGWFARRPWFSVARSSPDRASESLMDAPADIVIVTAGAMRWPDQRRDVVQRCQELRRRAGPGVSFLLLGRAGERRGRRIARRAGADLFLTRPASPDALAEAVAAALAHRGYGT